MEILYLICLLLSVGLMLWSKIYDVRNSTIQFVSLLIVVVSNLGFYFLYVATNIDEAILAQKIAYFGGSFLPTFYLLWVLEICHIKLHRFISTALLIVQCVLFGFVCSIEHNDLFYKSIGSHMVDGRIVLDKVYGPLHALSVAIMCLYLIASFVIAIYSLVKNRSVDRRGLVTMVMFGALAVITYVIERLLHVQYEIMPIAYDVLLIGALFPVYDSSIYTVYENTDIITEQLDKVGFLTFNTNNIYKGCDDYMAKVFPELSNYALGQRIEGCSEDLQTIIDQISVIEERYANNPKEKHIHAPLRSFMINDRHYSGILHGVTNSFGKLKGYTIEITDDTEHHQALVLRERYNDELSKEVHDKTKRIRQIQQKTILGMAQMVESRDLSTGGHIKRTSDVVRIFAKRLGTPELREEFGFDRNFLKLVIRSAPMHDLGKIGVDDAILRKQGKFTDEEYEVMKKHSEIGSRMVHDVLSEVEEPDFVKVAENVAHYHHEKVNGKGYPEGLIGDEIPVEARIMALADVFDALVSKRCYKDAFSYDKAFDIIKNDSGTHFDARLAEVFLSCRSELEDYYNKSSE